MIVLYAAGERIGEWSEMQDFFPELAKSFTVEFRDDQGNVLAKTVKPEGPLCPWDPTYIKEDMERERAEGGHMTLDEFWKKMGVE